MILWHSLQLMKQLMQNNLTNYRGISCYSNIRIPHSTITERNFTNLFFNPTGFPATFTGDMTRQYCFENGQWEKRN